jgi:hypothetical protein
MTQPNLNLDPLQPEAREAVSLFAKHLAEALGGNLRSFSVVGSALTPDFHPKRSDINSVLVAGEISRDLLDGLARCGKEMGRRRLHAPLLLTEEHLRSSRDVFGVELLDFQLNHATILGADPFTGLEFKKSNLRLQGERELKAALIELRQGYIRSSGSVEAIGRLVMSCLAKLLPLLRALLWLKDVPRVPQMMATVSSAAKVYQFDAALLGPILELRQDGKLPPKDAVAALFDAMYRVVDQLSRAVDQMEGLQ